MPTASTTHDTPLGALTLLAGTSGLTGVRFDAAAGENDDVADRSVVLGASVRRLDQDLAGDREHFYLDVGTEFQRRVWRQLERIPYGTTIHLPPDAFTYREVELADGEIAPDPRFLVAPARHVLRRSSQPAPSTNNA